MGDNQKTSHKLPNTLSGYFFLSRTTVLNLGMGGIIFLKGSGHPVDSKKEVLSEIIVRPRSGKWSQGLT